MLLERHPEIAEACTFGLPDPVGGEMVAVALRPIDGARVEVEAVRRWCAERIRRDCVPDRWYLVGEIPKTGRGKVDRKAVMEACRRNDGRP